MSKKNEPCGTKTFTKLLGEVSAIITSTTAPKRKNVLWAYPLPSEEDTYSLRAWKGSVLGWVELGAVDGGSGNYDTLLDDSIEMIADVGGYPAGTTVADLKGDALIEMWDRLLFPNSPAVYEEPEALLAGSTPFLTQVGNSRDITLTGTFDQGDAGAVTSYSVLRGITPIGSTQVYVDTGVVLNSVGTITYEAVFNYADGPVLDDAYGNPDPSGQILAGSVGTNILTYKWVFPIYYGSDADGLSIDPTTGTKLLVEITGTTLTVTFPSDGPAFYFLAVPAGTPEFIKYFITEISKGSMGAGNAWEPSVPITITDDNFVDADYDLYITGFVTQFNLPVQFKQT